MGKMLFRFTIYSFNPVRRPAGGTETMARKDHIINLDWANNLTIKDYVEIIKNINISKLKTNYKRGLKLVDDKGCI